MSRLGLIFSLKGNSVEVGLDDTDESLTESEEAEIKKVIRQVQNGLKPDFSKLPSHHAHCLWCLFQHRNFGKLVSEQIIGEQPRFNG